MSKVSLRLVWKAALPRSALCTHLSYCSLPQAGNNLATPGWRSKAPEHCASRVWAVAESCDPVLNPASELSCPKLWPRSPFPQGR